MIDTRGPWHFKIKMENAPRRRTRSVCLTLAGFACALSISACDHATDDTDDTGDAGQDQVEDPTGEICQPKDLEPVVAECSGGDIAYCSYMASSLDFQFGPCLDPTQVECEPGDFEDLGPRTDEWEQEACGNLVKRCNLYGGVPSWEVEECNTPLVLSFTPAGADPSALVEFIDAEATPAASFDISMRTDSCVVTDWPTAATPWLAVDLDHSGTIDGGHELFGSGTRLSSGAHAQNGFAALASFDANHDGVVDTQDPRFAELLLWRDHDADRLSAPGELERLSDAGILSLPVDPSGQGSCDARDNCAAVGGQFSHAAGTGTLVDVYLGCK